MRSYHLMGTEFQFYSEGSLKMDDGDGSYKTAHLKMVHFMLGSKESGAPSTNGGVQVSEKD